jgi:lipopolysaccharide/colanic/teichoic acid biosynthesis glycosyltransferase
VQAVDIPADIFARPAPLRTLFERLVAVAGIALLSPVLLLALLSGRPLARRRCAGRFGREFDLLAGPFQLWNLLKGDVGLVGPKPREPGSVAPQDPILSARPGLVHTDNALCYLQTRTFTSDLAVLIRSLTVAVLCCKSDRAPWSCGP